MSRREISRCEARKLGIAEPCPRQWSELAPTDDEAVRHCGVCAQNVYFCATDEETQAHAREGHCLARLHPDESELPRMVMGQPPPMSRDERDAMRWRFREAAIRGALLAGGEGACAGCGYLLPRGRRVCDVCEPPPFF